MEFSLANDLDNEEEKTLLHSFRRTGGAALLFLTKEDLKERVADLEIAHLLFHANATMQATTQQLGTAQNKENKKMNQVDVHVCRS